MFVRIIINNIRNKSFHSACPYDALTLGHMCNACVARGLYFGHGRNTLKVAMDLHDLQQQRIYWPIE